MFLLPIGTFARIILPQASGGTVPFIDLGKMGGLSGGAEGIKK
jgi:hypothetical protein